MQYEDFPEREERKGFEDLQEEAVRKQRKKEKDARQMRQAGASIQLALYQDFPEREERKRFEDLQEEAERKQRKKERDARQMRQAGVSAAAGQISAFPRQLESLIRLSEDVEVVDVEEAVRIHREAIKGSCTDPKTGLIDASILTTGVSNTERKRKKEIGNALKKILETRHKNTNVSKQKLLMEIKDQSSLMITKEMFDEILEELHDEGSITLTGSGKSTVRLSSL